MGEGQQSWSQRDGRVHQGIKKKSSWKKLLCPRDQGGVRSGEHFSTKDALGWSSFRLLKDGLSACASAAEHRWGGQASLLTIPHDLVSLRFDFLVLVQVPSGPLQVLLLHGWPLLLDGGCRSAILRHGRCWASRLSEGTSGQ